MLLDKYLANLEELSLNSTVCLLALPVEEGHKFEMEVSEVTMLTQSSGK